MNVQRPSLRRQLRRRLLVVVLLAVLVAGALLTFLGTAVLRRDAAASLQLVARSASYTVEPALVFRDTDEMFDALSLVAGAEDVAEASVYDLDGHLLTRWSRMVDTPWQWLQRPLAVMLLPPVVSEPVMHDGANIGTVQVRGAGRGMLGFVLGGMGAILGCLLLSALAAVLVMRRQLLHILAPMRELAAVVHAVRVDRSLNRRVPEAGIAEFHVLGEDINALLAELESRQDVLERENAQLNHRASHDSLTGLHNRAVFEQRLARAVSHAGGDGGPARLALLFLDGDGFKQINDNRGHDAGDAVLVAMAGRIRGQVREGDLVARLGGDEFAVLLEGPQGADEAQRIARDIETAMRRPIALPGGASVVAGVSIGVALYPLDADSAAGLLRAADLAMYAAKSMRRR